MEYCKVYLNTESDELQDRKGFYVIGEIVKMGVVREEYFIGGRASKIAKKDKSHRDKNTFILNPVKDCDLVTFDYYTEQKYVEFTKAIDSSYIKRRKYERSLDLIT